MIHECARLNERNTYQTKENNPRGDDERGEESRDDARGQLWVWAERMCELGARVVDLLVWVNGRRRGRRDVEIEQVECSRAVNEGTEKKGDVQWGSTRGWKRGRGFGHVL